MTNVYEYILEEGKVIRTIEADAYALTNRGDLTFLRQIPVRGPSPTLTIASGLWRSVRLLDESPAIIEGEAREVEDG